MGRRLRSHAEALDSPDRQALQTGILKDILFRASRETPAPADD
jgi:hypothetical protein